MDDENAVPVDEDSIKSLQEAKKGKSLRFVMICKGIRILKLAVFRKGTTSSRVLAAKKEGFTGQPYWGVVSGQDQNLTFELSSADGFDKPPGKELILKDFLKSEADFKCVPEYRIVSELTPINESDDESDESEGTETPAGDAPVDPAGAERRRKVADVFAKLSPKVSDFVRAFPDRRVEILKPTKLVKDFLDDPTATDAGSAGDALKAISQLLGELAQQPTSSGGEESPSSGTAPVDDQIASTTTAVDPQFRQRVKTAGEQAKKLAAPPDVLNLLRQAIAQLKAGQTKELEETLGQLEPRLTTLERSAQVAQEIVQATGRGNVRYRALKADWIQSRARAETELGRLIEEIVQHPDVVLDPRREEIEAAARNLKNEFPTFDNKLETLLDDAERSEDFGQASQVKRDAVKVIDEYLSEVERHPKLKQLDDTFFGKASIYGELSKTLTGLRDALSANA